MISLHGQQRSLPPYAFVAELKSDLEVPIVGLIISLYFLAQLWSSELHLANSRAVQSLAVMQPKNDVLFQLALEREAEAMPLKLLHLHHFRLDEALVGGYLAPKGCIVIALMEDLGDMPNLHVEDILVCAVFDLLVLPLHEPLEVWIG